MSVPKHLPPDKIHTHPHLGCLGTLQFSHVVPAWGSFGMFPRLLLHQSQGLVTLPFTLWMITSKIGPVGFRLLPDGRVSG